MQGHISYELSHFVKAKGGWETLLLGAVRASSCTNGVTSNGVAGSGLAGNGVVGHGVAGKNGAVAGAGSGGGEGESQLGQASRAMQDVAMAMMKTNQYIMNRR